MPKVYAPILEQAGFARRKLAVPAIEWVPQLDGVAQYWQLSSAIEIPPVVDFTITFYMLGAGNGTEGILEGTDFYMRFLRETDANFFGKNAQVAMGGTGFPTFPVSGTMPRNGNLNKIVFSRNIDGMYSKINDEEFVRERSTVGGGFSITSVGRFASSYFTGVLFGFDVQIEGVVTNSISLTDKKQGATQLPEVGSVSATMANYTEAVWKNKASL